MAPPTDKSQNMTPNSQGRQQPHQQQYQQYQQQPQRYQAPPANLTYERMPTLADFDAMLNQAPNSFPQQAQNVGPFPFSEPLDGGGMSFPDMDPMSFPVLQPLMGQGLGYPTFGDQLPLMEQSAHQAGQQQHKLKLENRAAELKEQLLKRKEQKEGTPPTQQKLPQKLPQQQQAPSDRDRKFVPHTIPVSTNPPRVAVSDTDIAALIADISGSAAEAAAETAANGMGLEMSKQGSIKPSNPTKEQEKSGAGNRNSTKSTNGLQNGKSTQDTTRATGQKREGQRSVPSRTTSLNTTPAARPNLPVKPPAAQGHNSDVLEEGEVSDATATQKNMIISTAQSTQVLRPATHEGRQTAPSREDMATVVSKAAQPNKIAKNTIELELVEDRKINGQMTHDGVCRVIDPNDNDLRDWLVFTNYYDDEHRTSFLKRRRRLAAIEAERMELLEEDDAATASRRRLPARSPSTVPQGDAPKHGAVTAPTLTGTNLPSMASVPAATTPVKEDAGSMIPVSAKRLHEDDATSQHTQKTARRNEGPRPVSRGRDRSRSPRSPYGPSRNFSPNRQSRHTSPFRYDGYRTRYDNDRYDYEREWSPDRQTFFGNRGGGFRGRGRGGYSPARRYDNYRDGNDSARGGSRKPYLRRKPKDIDLGRKGETRFFMVKSFNDGNVRQCMEDGLWSTQMQNSEILTTAFAQCKNVILFFSVNRSKAFQGYARMATTPSHDTPRPPWMEGIHWETTPPFRIDWLSTVTVSFHVVHYMNNTLNDNMSVIVGKDGQEIDDETGRELVKVMGEYADFEPPRSPLRGQERGRPLGPYFHEEHTPPPYGRGGRGGGGRGGRGGGIVWVKDEPMRD